MSRKKEKTLPGLNELQRVVLLEGSGKVCSDKIVPTDDEVLIAVTDRIDRKLQQMQLDGRSNSIHSPGDTCDCPNCMLYRAEHVHPTQEEKRQTNLYLARMNNWKTIEGRENAE